MFNLLRTPTFLVRQNQQYAMSLSRNYASKNLFVGNLSWAVKNDDLGALFSQHGSVRSARVLTDRDTGRSRGFGFVEMDDETEADQVIAKLNGYSLKGREIRVSAADRKPNAGPDSE